MIKYLKGLDALRALAALIVVWGHIELFKKNNLMPNLLDSGFWIPSGHIAVILFFVISGFLITYLLVKEKENTGTISLKKFYLRRILRIWPLYYLILFLSFVLFKVVYSWQTIVLCFGIFPNLAHALDIGWSSSPQIWSIGVEEQFYLFWPLLVILIPEKRLPIFLIAFFLGYSLLPHFIGFVNSRTSYLSETQMSLINKILYGTKFNVMSIGALFGFLYAKKDSVLLFLGNKFVAFLFVFSTLFLWVSNFQLKYFTDEFYAILFTISLYYIVVHPKINIDNRLSSFLGRISYGIYMYHWIIILLFLKFVPKIENLFLYNFLFYFFVFLGTILVSWISFNTIEKFFLTIKKKYETKSNQIK